MWIFLAQICFERAIAVADHHAADAAGCGRQEQPPKRRIGNGEIDLDSRRALAIGRRRHAERRTGTFVQAAAGAITGIVNGRRDALSIFERALHLAQPARLRKGPRRNADHLREGALKVKAAQSDAAGERAEGVPLLGVRLDDLARTLDLFNLCIHTEEDKPPAARDLSEDCSRFLGISGPPVKKLIEIPTKKTTTAPITLCHKNEMSGR